MTDILIPDFGGDAAEVIEILVAVGDSVEADQGLIVLETDKASVEVPAPSAGTIGGINVKVGDNVSEGTACMTFSGADSPIPTDTKEAPTAPEPVEIDTSNVENTDESDSDKDNDNDNEEVVSNDIVLNIPDIGTDNAEVIEMSVAIGDIVEEGDTLAVIETDKASVEMPAEVGGEIIALAIKAGDSIGTGGALATIRSATVATPTSSVKSTNTEQKNTAEKDNKAIDSTESSVKQQSSSTSSEAVSAAQPHVSATNISHADVHAGPAVRQLARKLDVDLTKVVGTGPRQRILQEDLHTWVKQQLKQPSSSSKQNAGSGLPPLPEVDYSKFGEVTLQTMSKIHKVTAANMLRSWLNVPHVTQFDDADITDLEVYRNSLKPAMSDKGIKVTPVAFLIKAAGVALQKNPKFNASIHSNGEQLVQRHYVNIGMAVATPAGLVVPVIKDVNQKSIWTIAQEVIELSNKARDGKLQLKEMQGGCFTISSLGAIGGKGFTPIVNAPEVGILGVSRSQVMPHWDGKQFIPRTMLPLALSYDHRAINGADAGKFFTEYTEILADSNYFPS